MKAQFELKNLCDVVECDTVAQAHVNIGSLVP
jgi:hypothetical protein